MLCYVDVISTAHSRPHVAFITASIVSDINIDSCTVNNVQYVYCTVPFPSTLSFKSALRVKDLRTARKVQYNPVQYSTVQYGMFVQPYIALTSLHL